MELIEVNNYVVKMRKTAIKARVHVIRQLIKQSKKLKSKQSAKKQMEEKNKRQLERLQIEINFLKHAKKDEISKFALANTQSFLPEIKAIKDKQEIEQLLKKRVLIRIANTSIMIKEVSQFRKLFPQWEEQLQKIFSLLGQKQRKKDQKKNTIQKDSQESVVESSKLKVQKDESEDSSVEENNSEESVVEEDDSEESSDEQENEMKLKDSKKSLIESITLPKSSGCVEIKQLDLNELIEQDSSDNESVKDVDMKNIKDEPDEIKDSFFIGGASEESDDKEDSENDEEIFSPTDEFMVTKRNDFFGQPHNRGRSRGDRGRESRGRGDRGRGDRGRGDRGRGDRGRSDRGRGDRGRGNRGRGDGGRGDWSHGNRGRGGFSDGGFQRFGGHETGYRGKNRGFGSEPKEALHPSWAARKSQPKLVIDNNFQAKKIKFDQDDRQEQQRPFVATPNLHPSWAAKKETNKGIQQFQGKKMVFDD